MEDTCDRKYKAGPSGGVSSQSKGGYISLHEEGVLRVEMVS